MSTADSDPLLATTPTPTPAIPPRQPTHPLPPHTILEPTESNISQVISIIASAFLHTPLMTAFMSELNGWTSTTPHTTLTHAITAAYFKPGITRVATSGGILASSGSNSAIAIWEPSTYNALDFTSGRTRWGPASREWTARVKKSRITHLGVPGRNPPLDEVNEFTPTALRPFWHLAFLARDPGAERVGGAVSAVVLPFLERVREEGVPAWLEATSLQGVAMYQAWGFRLVDTITFAVGAVGKDGWPCEDAAEAEGVSGYCMIYDGHLR